MTKRIGIITEESYPGLNAVIEQLLRQLCLNTVESFGFKDGYRGLY